MRDLIKQHGAIPHPVMPNSFETLARIIIGQQLSGKAANTIFARMKTAAGGGKMTARQISSCSDELLQSAGVSRPKIRALCSLAEHVLNRSLVISQLAKLDDEAVSEKIVQVKGLGPWSARIYLMFVLGRLDVFPENDLGICKAIAHHYKVKVTSKSLEKISAPWRPLSNRGFHVSLALVE